MATFVETDCTITHEGHTFESGGAFILDCTDGRQRGIVYVKPGPYGSGWGSVTDWHGKHIATAYFHPAYQGNFCRMQAVSFTFNGRAFFGRYCPNLAQLLRVKSSKASTPTIDARAPVPGFDPF